MINSNTNEYLKVRLPKIITEVQAGDSAAKEEFAELLLPYISKLIYKYKSTIDDDVESLAGQVIMKLLSKIDTIDVNKTPLGFITRTAINKAIDHHRKFKANSINNTVEYQAFRDYDTSYELSGLDTSTIENAESLIKDFLVGDDAEIVSKYYLHNMSLEEIAEETGYREEDLQYTLNYAKENISRKIIKDTNDKWSSRNKYSM
jgi:RNA polymerase sigma factor (sigma-70 family)